MTPKRYYTFMLDPELLAALKEAKARSPEWSEAAIIRQALREWLAKQGITVASDRRPMRARRRGSKR